MFSQSESMLGVLVVRCGWASDLKKAHGILNKSKVKVNGKVVKSSSLVIAVGSTIEACFSVKRQGSVDFSFLPHLISVHTHTPQQPNNDPTLHACLRPFRGACD